MNSRPETCTRLAPDLRRIIAPNPSPLTLWGTNTYILGSGNVAVIDPGPDAPAHMAAIIGAIGPGERISHIFVTHSHMDHAPLARPLADATGAQTYAFGQIEDGRSPVMRRLAAAGLVGGGEGADADFTPDHRLADGERVAGGDWEITALWTPGHCANHMCFEFGDAAFSGDLVMGWATSIVSPPDGDLTDFMASCTRLAGRGHQVLYPGHGDPVADPAGRIAWLLAHRRAREAAILAALADGPATIAALTARIYADTPPALHPAAMRNVLAHIIDLEQKTTVRALPALTLDAEFALNTGDVS